MLTSTVIFGTTPAVITALRGSLSIPQLVTFRSFVAALLFLVLAHLTARARAGESDTRRRVSSAWAGLALGALFVAPDTLIFYSSFTYIDTSVAVALGFIYPVLVLFIVAGISRQLPDGREVILSAAALIGVVLVLSPGSSARLHPLGVLLVCTSALIYATYAVVAGALTRRTKPLVLGSQVMGGICLSGSVVTLVSGGPFFPVDLRSWMVVVVNGVFLVAAFACYYAGLSRLGPGRTSLIDTAQPIAATLAGIAFLGERLSPGQYFGVLVIVCSVGLSSALSGRREVATVEPR